MDNKKLFKEIDTCNGDDLELWLAYMNDDNSAVIHLAYRDNYFDETPDGEKHKHEHSLLFTPELAIKFANRLLEFAKVAFVHNVTEDQRQTDELIKDEDC